MTSFIFFNTFFSFHIPMTIFRQINVNQIRVQYQTVLIQVNIGDYDEESKQLLYIGRVGGQSKINEFNGYNDSKQKQGLVNRHSLEDFLLNLH